jgi:AraC-like DNA-binding protein
MNKKEVLNLILLNAACVEHDADWNWKGINSPFARIYMVDSGSAQIVMPDGEHTICPGHLYMVPAFVTHSDRNNDFFVLNYIHVYEEQNIFDRLDFPFEVEANETDYRLVKRLLQINPNRKLLWSDPLSYDNSPTLRQNIERNEQFPFNSILETKGILLILFSKFLGKASFKQESMDERVVKALRHIRENVNKNISIEALSSVSMLSVDHFIRLFKKDMNCTPLQYINRKKIEKAQLMLMIGLKSIKEIATDLSFDDLSYFFRLFKKITGESPSEYRKRI